MGTLIIILLAVWLIAAVLGVVIKGLVWLTVIAAILFVATAIVGWLNRQKKA